MQRREGGGGQRKEDGKSRETLLLIQPNPSGLKEKEQESNSERHPEFHKYCFFWGGCWAIKPSGTPPATPLVSSVGMEVLCRQDRGTSMKSAVFDLHIVNGPEGSYTFMLTSGPVFHSPLHFHTPTLVVLLLVCSLQSLLEIGGSRTCIRLKTENLQ